MKRLAIISMILLIAPVFGQGTYGIPLQYVDTSGTLESFQQFQGKPLVVEAFATWCPHCHNEHKELVKLWDAMNNSINMLSLAVASDDNLKTIANYLVDYPSPWSVGWDQGGNFTDYYSVDAFPTIILFDTQGNFASCNVGERSFDTLSKDVNNLISDPQAYIDSRAGSGKCQSSWLNTISPVLILGGLLSLSFALFFFIRYLSSRKKHQ